MINKVIVNDKLTTWHRQWTLDYQYTNFINLIENTDKWIMAVIFSIKNNTPFDVLQVWDFLSAIHKLHGWAFINDLGSNLISPNGLYKKKNPSFAQITKLKNMDYICNGNSIIIIHYKNVILYLLALYYLLGVGKIRFGSTRSDFG